MWSGVSAFRVTWLSLTRFTCVHASQVPWRMTRDTKNFLRALENRTTVYIFRPFLGLKPFLGSIIPTHWHKAQMRRHTKMMLLQFHQQNCTQLYQHTQLKVTPNFHTFCSIPCPRKIFINLLTHKLFVK